MSYIETVEQRLKKRTELYSHNHNAAKLRPSSADLVKLESSLKKNSAFVRKLRNFTADQLDSLKRDLATLNMTKYLSEVAAALVEVKLKISDVSAVVSLCSEFHTIYSEFATTLFEYWKKTLTFKKDEQIANPSKLRVDLRVFADLMAYGIFSQRASFPLLISTLNFLTMSDREHFRHISIIISFCKHCGEDLIGFIPEKIQHLSKCYAIEVPHSNILSSDKQENIRIILKDYYSAFIGHLIKLYKSMKSLELQNKKILAMKGEIQENRANRTKELQKNLLSTLATAQTFAQLIGEQLPSLPADNEINSEVETTKETEISIWEDEETRRFYQEFPTIEEFLPQTNTDRQAPPQTMMTEEKLDEDLKDDDFLVEEPSKEEPVTVEEIEDSESVSNKTQLENFLRLLPNCVNKEMIDNAAIEFLISLNSRSACKKLSRALFSVHRSRSDLLPFYCRFVAILNLAIPDLTTSLVQLLKRDFKYHISKKDQINVESKVKVVRFIGEMVKFGLYSKFEALYCLKILLHNFTHHNIDMACALLETCGRYLYRSPDTHQRTKIYLELMMRLKTANAMETRYAQLIENTFYLINPPSERTLIQKSRPPMHQFLRSVLFYHLMGSDSDQSAVETLRSADWEDKQLADYIIKCLTSAWKIKYTHIPALANLVAGIVEYQEHVGSRVVDGVLEDIRIGMEMNDACMNQRRIAMIRYYGELYNYRLIDSNDVFKVLYSLITFGVSTDPESESYLDPPGSVFRIRLVLLLLETCASYFTNSESKVKLTYFLTFFQNYYWVKRSLSVWSDCQQFPVLLEQQFQDALRMYCPTIVACNDLEESVTAVNTLTQKLINELQIKTGDNNRMLNSFFLETIEETNEYTSGEDTGDENCDNNNTTANIFKDSKSLTMGTETLKEEEDLDFLFALDQMMTDEMHDRAKGTVRQPNVEITVPVNIKKRCMQDKNSNFILLMKKGNKQKCKSLIVPENSELVLAIRSQEEAKRREMEEVKQLTLGISERLLEEEE
ncbi:regulator of nonsense transcripts 2 isoform X2 [Nilaparvata lugens]|nr:regulator of nonsense transcripts 2 isoform X2 [Nilaparvata lugens]